MSVILNRRESATVIAGLWLLAETACALRGSGSKGCESRPCPPRSPRLRRLQQASTFGKQLTDNASSRSTKFQSNSDPAPSARTSEKQQIGDVGASNQQDQSDSSEKGQERWANVTDHCIFHQVGAEIVDGVHRLSRYSSAEI